MSSPESLPPRLIRWAGLIAIIQSLVGVGYAVLLLARQALGYRDPSFIAPEGTTTQWVGAGTGIFLLIIFGVVIWAAVRMNRGFRWGRGPVAMLEMIFIPISYYMFSGHAYVLAAITGLSAIVALVLLFHPTSVKWVAERYEV